MCFFSLFLQFYVAAGSPGVAKRRSEGVRIIMENSERLSGREPEYRLIDDTELLLTIYAPTDP